jgi:hypothetical protein
VITQELPLNLGKQKFQSERLESSAERSARSLAAHRLGTTYFVEKLYFSSQ